jgi:hypothetical protein
VFAKVHMLSLSQDVKKKFLPPESLEVMLASPMLSEASSVYSVVVVELPFSFPDCPLGELAI